MLACVLSLSKGQLANVGSVILAPLLPCADMGSAARRRANSTAYRTSNSAVTNTFKVDLHGLHVEEALQVRCGSVRISGYPGVS